ncbi:MAG TPA: plastocyanin/azurin family copper-binding protein [Longimicrobiaceae bacterium]|nr:plastocyanin/azurin family copper-binding protein [Longimicrobiaceae bacterium]
MQRKIGIAVAAALLAAAPLLVIDTVQAAPTAVATHTVRMIMEGNSAGRFDPAALTIRAGDVVRFVNVSGGPHNISFDPATIPDDVERVLSAAMPNQIEPLWGGLLTTPNAVYTISFAGIKPGRYEFFCVPHMYDRTGAATHGMKGVITVQ